MGEVIELRVAVDSAAVPGAELAVTVHLPDRWSERPGILFCAHGGTYSRRYWDFRMTGDVSYSFAAHLTRQGFAVIAFDELGAGDSARPTDPWSLTSFDAAAAHHAMAEELTRRLLDDGLGSGLGRPRSLLRIGVGHSLGGFLTVRQQARHQTYDAVAILGWTNFGLTIAPEWDQARRPLHDLIAAVTAGVPRSEVEAVLAAEFRDRDLPGQTTTATHRAQARANFYYDDVPAAVIAADEAAAAALAPRSPGPLVLAVNVPDIVLEDAASIEAPVLLGFGERDVTRDARRELAAYRSTNNLGFHLLRFSGHCHNFASSRREQWDWIGAWAGALAATA